MDGKQLNIVMFPWFSFGHFIPYLHLANRLAERGHVTSLLLPPKAKNQVEKFNLHPSLITLHPITVPHVDPLPAGYETTSDMPFDLQTHLATSLDRARPEVESIVAHLRPNLLFYDLAHWIPEVASKFGIKSVSYQIVCPAVMAFSTVPARHPGRASMMEEDLARPPPGYPSTTVVVDTRWMLQRLKPFGEGVTFHDRISTSLGSGDAIAYRTIREIEGKYCDYISTQFNKPVFLAGPVLPEPDKGGQSQTELEAHWAEWLGRFGPGSMVFCSFGSQFVFEKAQFQELVLGFEMTKMPFLLALRPPTGCATVEEALPEGFEERVRDRGLVYGGWVPQLEIMSHPSVGCFVNHCGPGTMWEALLSDKQMVFIPQLRDQVFNTKIMAEELEVAVEVKRGEDEWVSKESLCKAIKSVMDEESQIAALVRKNHAIWREKFLSPGFMSGYIDNFVKDLQHLVG